MPRESLGYVKMVWICPNCENKNPGDFRFCRGCGAAQPKDVRFLQAEKDSLLTDPAEIIKAAKGADIHCGFCGARNQADQKSCQACGADLATGLKRESGKVVGAVRTKEPEKIPCPYCGSLNPADALKCSGCNGSLGVSQNKPVLQPARRPFPKWLIAVIIIGAILCLVFGLISLTKTTDVTGTVSQVSWTRSVDILALQPVQRETWRNQIPGGSEILSCREELYGTSEQPSGNSLKVCGTPYTVDQGNGYAEMVQDCYYEVYEEYCSYQTSDWVVVDTLTTNGNDLNPYWPDHQNGFDQKTGNQQEQYRIVFDTPDGQKVFTTTNQSLFNSLTRGTEWNLKINSFGNIEDFEPR